MSKPIAYAVNYAETGTLTVGGSATDRPVARLYDRFIGPVWEDTGTGTRTITLDKGNTTDEIDAVIGASHNLNGLTLTATHDDNSSFTTPTTLGSMSATTASFRITGTASAERYWRLTIASAASAPQLGELFFTKAISFPFAPSDTNFSRGKVANVIKHETESGVVIAYVRGATRWLATQTIADLKDSTQVAPFSAMFDALDGGAKPFFYVDEGGTLRWVEWVNPEAIFATKPMTSDLDLHFREALG